MSTESTAVMLTGYNINDPRHIAATGPHVTATSNLPAPLWRVECWSPYDPETGKGGRYSGCPEDQSLDGARRYLADLKAQHETEGKTYAHYDIVEYVYDLTYETTVHTPASAAAGILTEQPEA